MGALGAICVSIHVSVNYRHESHPVIYTSLYLANQRMEVGSKTVADVYY